MSSRAVSSSLSSCSSSVSSLVRVRGARRGAHVMKASPRSSSAGSKRDPERKEEGTGSEVLVREETVGDANSESGKVTTNMDLIDSMSMEEEKEEKKKNASEEAEAKKAEPAETVPPTVSAVEVTNGSTLSQEEEKSQEERMDEEEAKQMPAEEDGEDGEDEEESGGYTPGKELFGLTGGWIAGEIGLKTPEGFEKAVTKTLGTEIPAASEAKKKPGKKKIPASAVPDGGNANPGKNFGGMAGGWPAGEVGLKDFNVSGNVTAASESALSVYLPLAIVSFVIIGGFLSFFFGVDVSSVKTSVQAVLTAVMSGSDGSEGSGGSSDGAGGLLSLGSGGQSTTTLVGSAALAVIVGLQVIQAIQRSVSAATEKAIGAVKISALVAAAATLAYKIVTER